MVNKILQYETLSSESWRRNIVAVSDAKTGEDDFEAESRATLALVPAGLSSHLVSSDANGYAAAHSALLQAWNSGAGLVTYNGHGSVEVWAGGNLLRSGEIAAELQNGSRLPVVLIGTCLNGFFHDLYTTSVAEALLGAPNGGAAAVFASSGLTPSSDQMPLQLNFLRAFFDPSVATLGECAIRARAASLSNDVRRTWILFGDPAMRMARP